MVLLESLHDCISFSHRKSNIRCNIERYLTYNNGVMHHITTLKIMEQIPLICSALISDRKTEWTEEITSHVIIIPHDVG